MKLVTYHEDIIYSFETMDRRRLKKYRRRYFLVRYENVFFARIIPCQTHLELIYLYRIERANLLKYSCHIFVSKTIKNEVKKKYQACRKKVDNKKIVISEYASDYIEPADKMLSVPLDLYLKFNSEQEYIKWKLKI